MFTLPLLGAIEMKINELLLMLAAQHSFGGHSRIDCSVFSVVDFRVSIALYHQTNILPHRPVVDC